MRKALSSVIALGAILICLPASAQTVSALNVSKNVVQGGQTTVVTATLSAAAPAGGARVVFFSYNPGVLPLSPTPVDVSAGATTATLNLTPLPVDNAAFVTIGAQMVGSSTIQTASFTLQAGPAFRWRLAVYRPTVPPTWFLRNDDGSAASVQWGQVGDLPLPDDYLGDHNGPGGSGRQQIAVYRPSTAQWFIRSNTTGAPTTVQFGQAGVDLPAPSDYLGQRKSQIAVLRESTSQLFILNDPVAGPVTTRSVPTIQPGDIVQFADLLGSGHGELTVYHSTPGGNSSWITDNGTSTPTTTSFGAAGDIPVAGPYQGTGKAQLAVFRPSTSTWFYEPDAGGPPVTNVWPSAAAGGPSPGDVPVPADYFGVGHLQLAVYRPATAQWIIRTDAGDPVIVSFGGLSGTPPNTTNDIPMPAAYAPRFGP